MNIETIGGVMRHQAMLRDACRACGHGGLLDPHSMVAFVGAGRRVDKLLLVCRECDPKDFDAQVHRHRSAKPTPL
jgi:hypothetical protein